MCILVDSLNCNERIALQLHKKKMDGDEKLVRKILVREWTRVLNKYAHPGMPLPSLEGLRRELVNVGLEAAVDAVVDEHWFVFTWMIRDDIRAKIEAGLDRFDLADLIEDVRVAQNEPELLIHLRAKIKRHIMEDF